MSITGSVGLFSTRVLTPNLSGRERDLIGALKVSTTLSVLSVRSLQVWTGMLPLFGRSKACRAIEPKFLVGLIPTVMFM